MLNYYVMTVTCRNLVKTIMVVTEEFVFLFSYRAFSHDVTAAILVFQNNETAAILVFQTNPVGVELFSYVNTFFCSNKFAWLLAT